MSEQQFTKRGVEVEAALIEAAAEALATVGPRAMSVRSVAAAAGVNHGQVHHYFGGKQGLVTAAMRLLAAEHFENTMRRWAGSRLPPAKRLREDDRYVQAALRTVLDGDLDTALLEISDEVSVPRRLLAVLTEWAGLQEPTLEIKAALIASLAIELGWAALEPFLLQLADVSDDDASQVADMVMRISRGTARVLNSSTSASTRDER
ncbi:MAG: TetR/AcrR family transcriptional regulator [Pseudomonadota bacterium]|nr:TetR/AcrR family transcriptional regulator [Pseudomonadota bacterium]